MTPIIRIVHVSDMHRAPRRSGLDTAGRRTVRAGLRSIAANAVCAEITRRVAGHDLASWNELRRSIPHELAKDTWPATHLVATGDLSTWGDDQSIDEAIRHVHSIASAARIPDVTTIYGNHDVWIGQPGTLSGFPLFSNGANLDLRRTRLHLSQFPLAWPRIQSLGQLPNGGRIQLVSLNTIQHGQIVNAVAAGRVDRDNYWGRSPGNDQLQIIRQNASVRQDMLIMLTHHPVHDPRGWATIGSILPATPHVLGNAASVASALAGSEASVVLSGHTHEVCPPVGASTGGPPNPAHSPLRANQLQLITGTASQIQFGPNDKRKPHVWQLIMIHADTSKVRVERVVFALWPGEIRFEAVTTAENDPTAIADVWEFSL